MAAQKYVDDPIVVTETIEDTGSITNQMVAAVLGFLNEHLKLVSQDEEVKAKGAACTAADVVLQNAIDVASPHVDRFVGNNTSQVIDNSNEILSLLDGLKDSDSFVALLANISARIDDKDDSENGGGSL